MNKKTVSMIVILALVALLLLTAYTPGGRVRIPTPGAFVTQTAQAQTVQDTAPRVGMPPRVTGTPVPPICNQPRGPRC